jgi:hypothetical protein
VVNSREKGKVAERQARDAVRTLWNSPDCYRSAQACGSFSADLLGGPPGLHLEVKHYAGIAALRFLRQAETDAAKGETPVVLMRENGETEWTVMVRMKDAEAFARKLLDGP